LTVPLVFCIVAETETSIKYRSGVTSATRFAQHQDPTGKDFPQALDERWSQFQPIWRADAEDDDDRTSFAMRETTGVFLYDHEIDGPAKPSAAPQPPDDRFCRNRFVERIWGSRRPERQPPNAHLGAERSATRLILTSQFALILSVAMGPRTPENVSHGLMLAAVCFVAGVSAISRQTS
jgi:hypothetical protein